MGQVNLHAAVAHLNRKVLETLTLQPGVGDLIDAIRKHAWQGAIVMVTTVGKFQLRSSTTHVESYSVVLVPFYRKGEECPRIRAEGETELRGIGERFEDFLNVLQGIRDATGGISYHTYRIFRKSGIEFMGRLPFKGLATQLC